ncbi:amidohydrolase family protein [Hoeflea sp. WL0058]|uniref:Amidohydrolase family protein n=1 Tax=Flavimaribacter sediminis TaxID=2865987 RepID=A0AAE3D0D6_9HYPH|nr:amidohydrolase family protein [Flavimaribacter sediminis]MBW8636621.1 amidohydrolase family protein [Flavimaribacter sediminis]
MGAIDIVCNLFTPQEVAEGRTGIDESFKQQVRMSPEMRGGVTIDDYLAKMDRADIDRALLIAVRAGDMAVRGSFEITYERVAEVCRAKPDRFSGLAGVDPFRGMQGIYDLERGVKELGFVGAHLYPHWFGLAPNDRRYYPYYSKCCELDIPIMMQVGHNLIYSRERRLPSVGRPITLDEVAIDFPELKLIGIHIGIPWTDEMISMAWKHENIFIGVDAYAPKHWPSQLVHYLNTYGREKVLFGTDWPVIDPERAVKEVDALNLRPESKDLLMRENALRIFRLPESGKPQQQSKPDAPDDIIERQFRAGIRMTRS